MNTRRLLLLLAFFGIGLSVWYVGISHSRSSQKSLCVVAGKSGGHIIPGMTYVKELIQNHPDYNVLFFSTDTELDRSIIALYPFVTSYVPLRLMPFPGKEVWRYPFFFWDCVRAFSKSFIELWKNKPERVISMGGAISVPVCLAAWCLRIPIDLFELNAVPGKAVIWLAPLAERVFVCFEQAKRFFNRSVQLVPYPLRFGPQDKLPADQAKRHLGLDPAKKTLLVLGGSQGSRSINELMKQFFAEHHLSSVQLIHQAGASNVPDLKQFYADHGQDALVFDYLHDLRYAYSAADLVIARAGAGTLFELQFFGKKSLIIPLETTTTAHQVDNARAMAQLSPDLFTVVLTADIAANREKFYQLILERIR